MSNVFVCTSVLKNVSRIAMLPWTTFGPTLPTTAESIGSLGNESVLRLQPDANKSFRYKFEASIAKERVGRCLFFCSAQGLIIDLQRENFLDGECPLHFFFFFMLGSVIPVDFSTSHLAKFGNFPL